MASSQDDERLAFSHACQGAASDTAEPRPIAMQAGSRLSAASFHAAPRPGRESDQVAAFFFAFGLVAFGTTGGSGVPSIEDRRPDVKV